MRRRGASRARPSRRPPRATPDPAARLSSPPAQSMRGTCAHRPPPRRRSMPLAIRSASHGRRRLHRGYSGSAPARAPSPREPPAASARRRQPVQNVTLSREQAAVFQAIEGTREHVFVTGRAGTGKSTLLNHLNWHTQKQIVICAPTGVAALNVGGQTIHSLFRLPIGVIADHDIDQNDTVRKILNAMDTLVIDEVSMVNADLMDAMDRSLRQARQRPHEPFGGVQVVLFGDPYQLAPVPGDGDERALLRRHLPVDVVLRREGLARGRPAHLRARRDPPPARRRVQAHAQRRAARRGHRRDRRRAQRRRRAPAAARAGRDHARDHATTRSTASTARSCTGSRAVARERGRGQRRLRRTRLPGRRAARAEGRRAGDVPAQRQRAPRRRAAVGERHDRHGHVAEARGAGRGRRRGARGRAGHVGEVRYTATRRRKKLAREIVAEFTQFPLRLAWAVTIHKSQGASYETRDRRPRPARVQPRARPTSRSAGSPRSTGSTSAGRCGRATSSSTATSSGSWPARCARSARMRRLRRHRMR